MTTLQQEIASESEYNSDKESPVVLQVMIGRTEIQCAEVHDIVRFERRLPAFTFTWYTKVKTGEGDWC